MPKSCKLRFFEICRCSFLTKFLWLRTYMYSCVPCVFLSCFCLSASVWETAKKPPNWQYPANKRSNDAFKSDEELMVWMRTAALPTFRKLHRRVNHSADPFTDGLPAGNYTLNIDYGECEGQYRPYMRNGKISVAFSSRQLLHFTIEKVCLEASFFLFIWCAFLSTANNTTCTNTYNSNIYSTSILAPLFRVCLYAFKIYLLVSTVYALYLLYLVQTLTILKQAIS